MSKYDEHLSLASVEDQTIDFMKQIQSKCKALGLHYKTSRQSAMVSHTWRRSPADSRPVLEIDGWHGTGKWGKGKLWHTWYPQWDGFNKMPHHDFVGYVSNVDFVNGQAYFMTQEAKDEYLKNLTWYKTCISTFLDKELK